MKEWVYIPTEVSRCVLFSPVRDTSQNTSDRERVVFRGDVKDMWSYVMFTDGVNTYNVVKWAHIRSPWEEPLLDNFDWWYIFKIWATVNHIQFYEDTQRNTSSRKLYFIDDTEISLWKLLEVPGGGVIYAWKGNPFVKISKYSCYTWVRYADGEIYALDTIMGNCYFI